MGVALGGSLPYTSAEELYNGRRWRHHTVNGHLYAQGNVQLGQYPVFMGSTVVINADADEDGQWFFESDAPTDDFEVGADGELALGWERGVVSLTLPVASGSVLYRAHTGRLMVHGHLEELNPFNGTALDLLFPDTTGGTIWGYYNAVDDFTLHAELASRVMGFPTSDLDVTLDNDGLTIQGRFVPSYGDLFGDQSVEFSGSVDTSGQFMLTGIAQLNLGELEMADAVVTWSNAGLNAAGTVDIPGLIKGDMSHPLPFL